MQELAQKKKITLIVRWEAVRDVELFSLYQVKGSATEHGSDKEGARDQRQEKLSFRFQAFSGCTGFNCT